MDSAQIWSMIGVFAAIIPVLYAMMRDLRRSIIRELRAEFHSALRVQHLDLTTEIQAVRTDLTADNQALRSDLTAEIREFRADTTRRFEAIGARFDSEREYNNARFGAVEHRLDALESDLTIIKGALIGKISA